MRSLERRPVNAVPAKAPSLPVRAGPSSSKPALLQGPCCRHKRDTGTWRSHSVKQTWHRDAGKCCLAVARKAARKSRRLTGLRGSTKRTARSLGKLNTTQTTAIRTGGRLWRVRRLHCPHSRPVRLPRMACRVKGRLVRAIERLSQERALSFCCYPVTWYADPCFLPAIRLESIFCRGVVFLYRHFWSGAAAAEYFNSWQVF